MNILEKNKKIREYINSPSKQRFEILSNKKRRNIVCASLDAINDTQWAIEDYKSREIVSYLDLSWLLQSMFLQSDASWNLSDAIQWIERKKDTYHFSKELKKIREVRNKSIWHPTKRQQWSYVVYTPGLKKWFMTLALYETTTTFEEINILDLISSQEKEIGIILDWILNYISTTTMKHRESFKKPLSDYFWWLDYTIQKIYEWPKNWQYQSSVNSLKEITTKLKEILNEMYWSLSEIDSIEWSIKKIEIILWFLPTSAKLGDEYIINNIFTDSLNKEIIDLKEYIKEVDKEFNLI